MTAAEAPPSTREEATHGEAPVVRIQPPIPVLRVFDADKTMAFYRGFLGFAVDWEHRFAEDAPRYWQVSRDGCTLHLSEHHGDATPGSRAFVPVTAIDTLHAELAARDNPFMRPGLETQPWGREVLVIDPFGNRLTFCELS